MMDRVVLVTGVGGYWGSRVASRLVTEAKCRVIGIDATPPQTAIQGLDYVQADVRNPLLAELLAVEKVDTVCHLAFIGTPRPTKAAYDFNVTGTSHLLRACAEADVRKVVMKSSIAVYGARPSNSAFLAEDHALRGSLRMGHIHDLVEVESFSEGFHRETPGVVPTILRFANIVGPTADTAMNRFLRQPWTPALLGFDPMMQVIHESDVVAALVHAVYTDATGPFNIAAEDALPLNKLRGLAGKPPMAVFHPFAYWSLDLLSSRIYRGRHYPPLDPDYLRYPCIGDLTRMRQELGFRPHYRAEDALRELAEFRRLGSQMPPSTILAQSAELLRDTMEQRQRAREGRTTNEVATEERDQDER
jgi:UDP-glucose 4-epimerase